MNKDSKTKDLKTIHFIIPRVLYEEFYRCFPGRGEMKSTFVKLMKVAIKLNQEGDPFSKAVIDELENRGI